VLVYFPKDTEFHEMYVHRGENFMIFDRSCLCVKHYKNSNKNVLYTALLIRFPV